MPAPSGKTIALGGPSVFEIRTYTAAEGKLDALHARFRDHTLVLVPPNGAEDR